MTVAKLIELLAAVPQDAEVLMHSEDDRQFSTPTAVQGPTHEGPEVVIYGD